MTGNCHDLRVLLHEVKESLAGQSLVMAGRVKLSEIITKISGQSGTQRTARIFEDMVVQYHVSRIAQ